MTAAAAESNRRSIKNKRRTSGYARSSRRGEGAAPSTTGSSPRGTSARARRSTLHLLDQASIRCRARRRNALLAMFIVVLSGFFAVAFVHAQLVAGQHELDTVRSEIAEASAQRATVERAVDEASAPHEIVDRATEIGMVRAVEPVYLAANGPVPDVPEPVSFSPDTESTPAPDPLPDPEPRDVELIAAPASDYDPVQDAAELASVETVVETADPVPSTADETDGEVAVGALPVEAEPRSGLAGAAVTTGSETPEAVLAGASTSDQPTSTVAGSSAVSEGVASG